MGKTEIVIKKYIEILFSLAYLFLLKLRKLFHRMVGKKMEPRLTILYYHSINDLYAFKEQMKLLKRVANIVTADFEGELPGGRDAVAITFDDAFETVYSNALPILRDYKISATIFIPTGNIGQKPLWDMEKEAVEKVAGKETLLSFRSVVDYGSHTVSHPFLTQISDCKLTRELSESRSVLEKMLDCRIDTLAFPYGDHNEHIINESEKFGYRYVYSIAPERIDTGNYKLLRGRTAVSVKDSSLEFQLKTKGAYAWLPYAWRIKRNIYRFLNVIKLRTANNL